MKFHAITDYGKALFACGFRWGNDLEHPADLDDPAAQPVPAQRLPTSLLDVPEGSPMSLEVCTKCGWHDGHTHSSECNPTWGQQNPEVEVCEFTQKERQAILRKIRLERIAKERQALRNAIARAAMNELLHPGPLYDAVVRLRKFEAKLKEEKEPKKLVALPKKPMSCTEPKK
jgi:hypothetical protein